MDPMDPEITELLPEVVGIRQHLHMYPEVSGKEYQTAHYLQGCLHKIGIPAKIVARTGVVSLLEVNPLYPTAALRAEIDALPIPEKTGVPYQSRNAGVMHACGHDGIAATALGLAQLLKRHADQLKCNVKFLFEPSEEIGRGAKSMLAAHAMENPKVDRILVFHYTNSEPLGMEIQRGISTAMVGRLEISIQGKAAHWCSREAGIDAISASERVVREVEGINAGFVSDQPYVVGIGTIHGGIGHNIVADSVKLTGTLRAAGADAFHKVYDCLQKRMEMVERQTHAKVTVRLASSVPPIYNAPNLVKAGMREGRKVFGDKCVLGNKLYLAGDNAAYYFQKAEGLRMVFFAQRQGEENFPLHNPQFNFNEAVFRPALTVLYKSQLTDDCYPDPELKTLTFDVGFYISRDYSKRGESESSDNGWFPSPEEYAPGITTSEWVALLEDKNVFTQNSLEIMKRMQDYGGAATCTQLAVKYGESKNFYNAGSVGLAKRVAEKTGCPVMSGDSDDSKWWPILYIGRHATKDEDGSYVWKLRSELSDALNQVDLGDVDLYAKSEGDEELGYWWLNANPKIWSFSDLQVGEVQEYTLYNENGNKRRIFQNFIDAKTGDFVIGYESNPVKQVVALVKVSAANDGQKIYFEKTESLANPIDYQTLKECPELEKMEFFQNPNGSFFKLTKGEYEFIMDMIRDENPLNPEKQIPSYTKQDFLSEVYMTEEKYDRLAGVLLNKMNIILQGAPGVGKTFAAKRLAYSLMGEKDDNRIEFVQFHQNYSYEDFMMGYKPSGDSFELKYGVFYRFCKKAENQPDKKFFFIIDEINRGNLSKIFGELLMLIEKDYRGTKATLAYNGMPFTVPENLYIIGMMNTADRSLAMIDYALRRRFSFFEIDPGFESKGFSDYQKTLENDTFDELIQKVIELNDEISRDKSLGKGFCIGHSYFCGRTKETCTDEWMQSVVDYDILPMLSEYWFDDDSKVQRWDNILHGVFQ